MTEGQPEIIAIEPDDYHAEHVGWTADGRQFILTTPFEPKLGVNPGAHFIALYLFNSDGQLLEARIDELGPRDTLDEDKGRKLHQQRLRELGKIRSSRINIAPFSIQRFGTVFGLIVREPEDEDDVWAVEMQPGNYMAFFEPWDSGEYDT